jgi:DNA invertase Pin-like site-specific DNA recombinase
MTRHHDRFVSYLRVSTERQGKSGLGIDAQRQAIADYLNGSHWTLAAEFVETESGKHADRPQLQAALAACRKHKARLIIAKLDRLSRNVAFVATMMDSTVEFLACDFPQANRLTLHILAAVAEHERRMISERTKAALAAAKRRGVKLGGRRLGGGQRYAAIRSLALRRPRRRRTNAFSTSQTICGPCKLRACH